MQLKEIMTPEVERIHANVRLKDAAEKMKILNVGLLPVYDGDRLVGILSDRDITVRAAAEGRDPRTTRVDEVMTAEVVYCFEDQAIEEAAKIMQDKKIRRLIVLNRDKRLVGIVSLDDLAGRTGQEKLAGETLERVSKPSVHRH